MQLMGGSVCIAHNTELKVQIFCTDRAKQNCSSGKLTPLYYSFPTHFRMEVRPFKYNGILLLSKPLTLAAMPKKMLIKF